MCVYYGMHVNDFGHPSLMNNRHITYTFPSAGFLCLYLAMHKNEWHVMHEIFLIPASPVEREAKGQSKKRLFSCWKKRLNAILNSLNLFFRSHEEAILL